MTPLCILHGAELPARLKSDHLSQVSLLQSAAIAMLEIISLSQSHTLNGPAVNPLLLSGKFVLELSKENITNC